MVTPFYNTADFLEECIQSVFSQTYTNWEYILVDNCSTDGSRDIAERYAAVDSRVRLYRETEFLGQVENYNRALRYVSSESKYCKIVQADDWIYPHCLAQMVAAAESGNNVGLVASFTLYGDRSSHGGLPLLRGPVYSGRDASRCQLLGDVLFGSPTLVMYATEAVRSRNQFFSTATPYFEDTEVCFEILRDHDFGFVPQVLTFNRRNNGSIWDRIDRYQPLILCNTMFTHRYGAENLEGVELVQRKRKTEAQLYDLFAHAALLGYPRDFWRFHAKGLESFGQRISWARVVLRALYIIIRALLNPMKTAVGLWRRVSR